ARMRARDGVARRVRDRLGPGTEPVAPQLSFAQQRLWFLDRLVPDSPFYNVPAAIRLRTPIDPQVLRATFNEIVPPHAVLPTPFPHPHANPFPSIPPH